MTRAARLAVSVLDGPWRGRRVLVGNPPPKTLDLQVRTVTGTGIVRYSVDHGPHGYFARRLVDLDETLPTLGWRGWRLSAEDGSVGLLSSNGGPWPTEGPLVASCWKGAANPDGTAREPEHDAPAAGCGCGIYAARTLDWLRGEGYTLEVFGIVTLWGRSRQHEHGFRYERAYPLALILNDDRIGGEARGGNILGDDLGSDDADAEYVKALATVGLLRAAYRVPVALGAPERGLAIMATMRERGLLPKWAAAVLPPDLRAI